MRTMLNPDDIITAVEADINIGFCIKCGAVHYNVEPDARKYRCQVCEKLAVYGARELLSMGYA